MDGQGKLYLTNRLYISFIILLFRLLNLKCSRELMFLVENVFIFYLYRVYVALYMINCIVQQIALSTLESCMVLLNLHTFLKETSRRI